MELSKSVIVGQEKKIQREVTVKRILTTEQSQVMLENTGASSPVLILRRPADRLTCLTASNQQTLSIHHLDKEEIDDLIIALTSLRIEIA
jgi:hypothetical protein